MWVPLEPVRVAGLHPIGEKSLYGGGPLLGRAGGMRAMSRATSTCSASVAPRCMAGVGVCWSSYPPTRICLTGGVPGPCRSIAGLPDVDAFGRVLAGTRLSLSRGRNGAAAAPRTY